eukprot:164390-Prymnesium_polylepis.2
MASGFFIPPWRSLRRIGSVPPPKRVYSKQRARPTHWPTRPTRLAPRPAPPPPCASHRPSSAVPPPPAAAPGHA